MDNALFIFIIILLGLFLKDVIWWSIISVKNKLMSYYYKDNWVEFHFESNAVGGWDDAEKDKTKN